MALRAGSVAWRRLGGVLPSARAALSTQAPLRLLGSSAPSWHQHKRQQRWQRWRRREAVAGVVAGGALAAACGALQTAAAEGEEDGGGDKRPTLVDRQVESYEERLRSMSTPDKVFRYFATVEVDGVQMMRQSDFIRAIMPRELQPREYGLDLFETLPETAGVVTGNPKDLMLFRHDDKGNLLNDEMGFITFSEFLFLMTVLTASKRQFELAFKVYDLDGNGTVDLSEFSAVTRAVEKKSISGSTKSVSGATEVISPAVVRRSIVLTKFFGSDGKKKLCVESFMKFLDDLQQRVLHLEFLWRIGDQEDRDHMDAVTLSHMLLAKTRIAKSQHGAYLDRVRERYPRENKISFEEVDDFVSLLQSISDLEMALSLWYAGGGGICRMDFARVSRKVTGIHLSDAVLDLLFALFDADGDGELHYTEFIQLFKNSKLVGKKKKRQPEFSKGLAAIFECAKLKVKGLI